MGVNRHHPNMLFLSLDLGSSQLKVTVFDERGRVVAASDAEIPGAQVAGNQAELDPDLLWRAVSRGLKSVLSCLSQAPRAAAISSHGESLVALDAAGQPVSNIVLNIDNRSGQEIAAFVDRFTRAGLYSRTGLPPHPMYTLTKIAWLTRHRPDLAKRVRRFVCLEDYLFVRMGLEAVISEPLASRTMGLDLHTGNWDEELVGFAGIGCEQLSRVVPSGTPVGVASQSAAEELGLPSSLLWCTGGHDQVCASLGSGVRSAGTIADGTGTFECATALAQEPRLSSEMLQANLPWERHAIPGHTLVLGYLPGGIALKWLRDACGFANADAPNGAIFETMLESIPQDPTGIFFFPYLLGSGTPWLEADARASIWGLTSHTRREDLVKAAIEGVTFEMRLNLDILAQNGVERQIVHAVGGGAKSPEWLQLKADIFNSPIRAVPGEASSRGAAICAAMGVGAYKSWDEAIAAMVQTGRAYEPREAFTRRYAELYAEYCELADKIYGGRLRLGVPHIEKRGTGL